MTTAALRRTDRFPGTRVVTGCFIVLAVSSGLGFYGLAVYLNAFTNERDWPVASISLATTVYFVVGGRRRAVHRPRSSPAATCASRSSPAASSAALRSPCSATSRSAGSSTSVYAVFALGFAGAGLVPVTTVVTRWYHVRRSVALSVASTGLSAGGILLTPVAKWLIDEHGLATSTPILGVVWVLGIVPFALWLVRPDPAALGWMPDGERVQPGRARVRRRRARRSTRPCAPASSSPVTIAYVLVLGAQVGGIQQLVKLVEDRTDESTAALATIVVAGTSVVARLVGGRVVARLPMAGFTVGLAAVQARGARRGWRSPRRRWRSSPRSSCSAPPIGNILMLQPLLIAERFGVLDYPRIFSRAQFITMLGTAGGPLLLGWLYDNAGGYRTSYLVAAVLLAGRCVRAGVGRSRYRARPVTRPSIPTSAASSTPPPRPAWRSSRCASPTAPRRRPTPRRRSVSTSARSSRA